MREPTTFMRGLIRERKHPSAPNVTIELLFIKLLTARLIKLRTPTVERL